MAGNIEGEWVKATGDVRPYLASGSNTVSFEFPGGTSGLMMIGVFAAGIIIGFMMCAFAPKVMRK